MRSRCGADVILYPAIDILDGRAVRLVKGDFERKTVYDQDPLAAARGWVEQGAGYLHVVDLDGAKAGAPVNLEHLQRIAGESGVPVQFGGGLRTRASVDRAFDAGAARVILGTAIFTNPDLPFEAIDVYGPERVLVSIDARGGFVATHGWMRATEMPAEQAIERWRERDRSGGDGASGGRENGESGGGGDGEGGRREGGKGVGRFVFTDIDHDGMLDGPSADLTERAARAAGDGKLIVSGGIGELAHLRALARLHAKRGLDSLDGVIVGKALYERRFTVAQALEVLGGG